MKRIALITPLKDERHNLDRFFNSIASQSYEIAYLVIIENDSVDGSREYLEALKKIDNVHTLEIINMTFKDKSYDLGFKYARVVAKGLEHLKGLDIYSEIDYVGILDADCFPEKGYYSKLVSFLDKNQDVGITSGVNYTDEGKVHISNKNFVRGNSRLWNKKCLEMTGFPIEPSPDSLTVALAHIHGWKTRTVKDAKVIAREVNDKVGNYYSFGERAYYRGESPIYIFFRTLYLFIVKRKFRIARDYFIGYFSDFFKSKPRIQNKALRKYYGNYLLRKMMFKD